MYKFCLVSLFLVAFLSSCENAEMATVDIKNDSLNVDRVRKHLDPFLKHLGLPSVRYVGITDNQLSIKVITENDTDEEWQTLRKIVNAYVHSQNYRNSLQIVLSEEALSQANEQLLTTLDGQETFRVSLYGETNINLYELSAQKHLAICSADIPILGTLPGFDKKPEWQPKHIVDPDIEQYRKLLGLADMNTTEQVSFNFITENDQEIPFTSKEWQLTRLAQPRETWDHQTFSAYLQIPIGILEDVYAHDGLGLYGPGDAAPPRETSSRDFARCYQLISNLAPDQISFLMFRQKYLLPAAELTFHEVSLF